MIQMESLVQVADNTGARSAKMIGVIGSAPVRLTLATLLPATSANPFHRFREERNRGEGRGSAHRRPDSP